MVVIYVNFLVKCRFCDKFIGMFKNVLNLVGMGDFNYEIRMYYFIVKVLFFLIIKFVKRRDKCRYVFWRRI